ncbi:hypothetical protein THAOC_25598 [Thalassiosira oceanica]|uniref:Uncharacterized protein n=1 Tax=Thalassiosira oceanica TaxID=159749 RepID=K0RM29_THAOC|nr:hypothetical protein THAOC_25598 [Thalassiosira oceanica]|eukprot:EJK54748.1 hypothetical protein THAOC_25598 [Thalassiosira oceanica]
MQQIINAIDRSHQDKVRPGRPANKIDAPSRKPAQEGVLLLGETLISDRLRARRPGQVYPDHRSPSSFPNTYTTLDRALTCSSVGTSTRPRSTWTSRACLYGPGRARGRRMTGQQISLTADLQKLQELKAAGHAMADDPDLSQE